MADDHDDGIDPAQAEQAFETIREYIVSVSEFELRKTIGRGAYGEVFFAVHAKTGRKVAVKRLMLDELVGKDLLYFCREVMVLSRCNNYFLLPFLGFSKTNPYVIVTDYVSRGSLFEALRRRPGAPRLVANDKILITFAMARGMMSLHRQNIIHRDLKSLNILLDDALLPKICDFGIARFLEDEGNVTRNMGTPHWMAPEMFETNTYTSKVDVYAFAIMVWEMMTEDVPFRGRDAFHVALAVSRNNERPSMPAGVPYGLRTLIQFCWDRNPDARPSFAQIAHKLAQKLVYFTGGRGECIDAFLKQFPFSAGELADIRGESQGWSEEFDRALANLADFDLDAVSARPGEAAAVDLKNAPLGVEDAPAEPRPSGTVADDETPAQLIPEAPAILRAPESTAALPIVDEQKKLRAPESTAALPIVDEQKKLRAPESTAALPIVDDPKKFRAPGSMYSPAVAGARPPRPAVPVSHAPERIASPASPASRVNIFLSAAGKAAKRSPIEQMLIGQIDALTLEKAPDYFKLLVEQFSGGKPVSMLANVFGAVSKFLIGHPEIVPVFVEYKLQSYLDFSQAALFDVNLRIVILLIGCQPDLVTPELVRALVRFANQKEHAFKLIKLLSVIITKTPNHPAIREMAQLYLDNAGQFLISPHFLSMMYWVFEQPDCAALKPACMKVFTAGIVSPAPGVPEAACLVFARIPFTARDLPLAELIASMNKGDLVAGGVDLLARIPEPPTSTRLVACLLAVGAKEPATLVTLCRIANTPKGAPLFLQSLRWLSPDCLPVDGAVLLWATLCQHREVMEALVGLAEFPPFLVWVARAGSEEAVGAVVPIMRRLAINAVFVQALDQAGFVQAFLGRCLPSANEALQDAAVLLIDKLGRVAWSPAFGLFVEALQGRLAGNVIVAEKALVCALVIAKHQVSWELFRCAKLGDVVQQCRVAREYQAYLDNFRNFIYGLL
jgi:hypothetical protein